MDKTIGYRLDGGELWFKAEDVCQALGLDLGETVIYFKLLQNRWKEHVEYFLVDDQHLASYLSKDALQLLISSKNV